MATSAGADGTEPEEEDATELVFGKGEPTSLYFKTRWYH